ncbi:hypothetical protein INT43_000400 [Umbelopsis isabellina]|uniref:Ras-GEF domain-containing protein n=1 Tax=Mortierella isabellina TaxID=91625 RepID=A0A8H7UG42_MORIS|nr:hypothetical protein INT43_000400 [Umbelopsis isabellina]
MDQIKSPVAKEPYTPPVNNHHTTCPVLASIAHFNFISAWVSTMIVMQSKLSRRGKVLEKFMHMAVALRNRNNYNTLMAVLAGINSASVLRLRHTRDWVSVKKIYKQFQSLERLMSTDRSFGSYRLALKASEAPGIPYLGIHNQDLLSLAEANKDFKLDGTIHWEKFRLMGDTILAMIRFQEPKFSIQPDAKILGFIAETELMNEDVRSVALGSPFLEEQFRQSTAIEPRLKATSTNRLRDLWFRVQTEIKYNPSTELVHMITADTVAQKPQVDSSDSTLDAVENLSIANNDETNNQSPLLRHKRISFKASPTTLNRRNTVSLADLIPAAAAAFNHDDMEFEHISQMSSLSRALTRVKTQMKTQRLKTTYLGKEWIRLALGLPVDESNVNCWRKPLYLREQDEDFDFTMVQKSNHGYRKQVKVANRIGRTFEIAAWYEWKRNPSTFDLQQVESKVERLRSLKLKLLTVDETNQTHG